MYEDFYGLQERPFDLSPNPRFLFLSTRHGEALNHLKYGLSGRPGVTVLIGDAGTGKTTLVKAALQAASAQGASAAGGSRETTIVHLSNPTLTRAEFYEYLAAGFRFTEEAGTSKVKFLRELETALVERGSEGHPLALIVDEAQSLPHELLEEIRLLTNVETTGGRTLTVVLVGQPELAARLNEDKLRQLKQRIALRCELAPLDVKETAAYVAARIRIAGGSPEMLFTKGAIVAVHEFSRGIPRTISVICDNALVSGFAADCRPVTRDMIIEVSRDFEFAEAAAARVDAKPAAAPRTSQPAGEPRVVPAEGPMPGGLAEAPSTAPPPPAPRRNRSADAAREVAAEPGAGGSSSSSGGSDRSMFSGFTKPRRFRFFEVKS